MSKSLGSRRTNRSAARVVKMPRPKHPRIIVVANQKGGVGKTTTAVNLSAALAYYGMNVLLIDSDMQANATSVFVENIQGTAESLYDVFTGEKTIAEIALTSDTLPNLKIVPASIDLSSLDLELSSYQVGQREHLLERAIADYVAEEKETDYIIIDCPPSVSLVVINALAAASEILLPVQAEYYGLVGMSQFFATIEYVSQALQRELKNILILPTMVSNTNLCKQVIEELENTYPQQTLKSVIPRNVRIGEAPSYRQSVIEYDPKCSGAKAYRELAWEIVGREK